MFNSTTAKRTAGFPIIQKINPGVQPVKPTLLFLLMLLALSFYSLAQPNTWVQKSDLGYDSINVPEEPTRANAVGFGIGTKGYIGTGSSGYPDYKKFKDFWEYDPATDTWTQKADFRGDERNEAVGFSIGSKGYIGTGSGNSPKKDFWEYDPVANAWTRKAEFGGTNRFGAVGFSIGNKGYIGTGSSGFTRLKDFWEYDPPTNTWTQKADFGGTARSDAAGFSIGSKGYIGTGDSAVGGNTKDFWEYNPATDTWTQKADFGGTARSEAVGFSIGTKGYLGTGDDGPGQLRKDFWEYNPASNAWAQKANFGGNNLEESVGFSIGGKGYIGTGESNGQTKDFWEYDPAANDWTQKVDFGETVRTRALGFSIGSKGYIGTGRYQDFWEYDPAANTWTQKAGFQGSPRQSAVAFSIGNKGYIGTGYSRDLRKDFWEYDPEANIWTQKADFGGTARYSAVGFSIGSKGYIGTGVDRARTGGQTSDFWEYDPATDTWTQKASFGGYRRGGAVGFSIGSKGYLGTGFYGRGYNFKDFWEYDPATDTWTQKADFGGPTRDAAVGFSIGSKGYIGTGIHRRGGDFFYFTDFWEYDPGANIWIQKADFRGVARQHAVGFSIGSKGYIGTGDDSTGQLRKDFWEYTPGGCPPPAGLRPTKISDTCARLNWYVSNTDVEYIKVIYRPLGDSVWMEDRKKSLETGKVICGLTPNTTYEWKVRNICADEKTGWVNGPNFTTTPSPAFTSIAYAVNSDNVQGNTSVQIMPNPNKGNFILQMQLPVKPALTTLAVYNNAGEKIWQQEAGHLSGGVSRNIALQSKLSTGVYVLMVQHGDTRLMQKVVVMK